MPDKSWSAAEGNRKKVGLHYTIGMLKTIKVNNVCQLLLLCVCVSVHVRSPSGSNGVPTITLVLCRPVLHWAQCKDEASPALEMRRC